MSYVMLDVIRKRAVPEKAFPLGPHWVMLVINGVVRVGREVCRSQASGG